MKSCYNCSYEWKEDYKPSYNETCENCGCALHCCKNCKFYDVTRYNNCSEPMAERVPDSEAHNFCTYFEFIDDTKRKTDKIQTSRTTFDNLFKDI